MLQVGKCSKLKKRHLKDHWVQSTPAIHTGYTNQLYTHVTFSSVGLSLVEAVIRIPAIVSTSVMPRLLNYHVTFW